MRTVMGFFYFCNTHTFSFLGPVLVFLAQEGPPDEFLLHFFRKGFRTRACTEIIYKLTQERFFLQFFCNVKKMSKKDPMEYVG